MITAITFATIKGLSAANTQLILGALLAVSEVLGADPRIKANGIVSFLLIQAKNYLKGQQSKN
jgi:hypothetical protein